MPIIRHSRYRPPWFFSNGHLQTVYPSVMRRLEHGLYERERIETSDNDFLDLDWARAANDRVVVLSHGLEGNSYRPYMVGMAKMLNLHGWLPHAGSIPQQVCLSRDAGIRRPYRLYSVQQRTPILVRGTGHGISGTR